MKDFLDFFGRIFWKDFLDFRIFLDFSGFFRILISCSNFDLKKINFLILYFFQFLFFIFIFLYFLFLFFDYSAKFRAKKLSQFLKFPRSMSQKIFWDFRFFPDLSGKIRIFYFLSQFLINFLFLFFVKNLFNFYIFFFYFWVFLLNLGSKMKIVQILKIPKVNESETPFSIY